MNASEIHALLVERFGTGRITGSNLAATDPWIEVAPSAILEVCRFLHDDPRLAFDHLNDLCGVDYFEADPKKQAKFGHEPHVEVVYHLSSYSNRHLIVL